MKYIILTLCFTVLLFNSAIASCKQGDCKNGTGFKVFKDNSTYSGDFKNGKFNGKGTRVYVEGKGSYTGEFLNGKFHGYGKRIYSVQDGSYEGYFIGGRFEGKGKRIYGNGKTKEGTWKKGKLIN